MSESRSPSPLVSLHGLPVEIRNLIYSYLNNLDFCHLALTSREMTVILDSRIVPSDRLFIPSLRISLAIHNYPLRDDYIPTLYRDYVETSDNIESQYGFDSSIYELTN